MTPELAVKESRIILHPLIESHEHLQPPPSYEVLSGAENFLTDLETEIKGAQSSVDLQFYVFEGDTVGHRVGNAIRNASQRGLPARLAVDHFIDLSHSDHYIRAPRLDRDLQRGIHEELKMTQELFQSLRREGAQVKMLKPFGLLFHRALFRDHKKMAVIDGNDPQNAVAYLGGFNICDHEYPWNTFMVKMRGEMVGLLQDEFNDSWNGTSEGKRRDYEGGYLLTDANGDSLITPDAKQLIANATDKVILESPYVWGKGIYTVLSQAALRDVDVSVVIPTHNNKRIFIPTDRIVRSLTKNGVNVYRYQENAGMTHTKALIADDTVSFGSSNFNELTAGRVAEANIVSQDPQLVSQIDRVLTRDISNSLKV